MTPAIDTRLHNPRLLVPVLELEEYLPDVDARADFAALFGAVVPVQVPLPEQVAGIPTDRLLHFPVVPEFLLEMRHVGRDGAKDVDLGRVGHRRFHADG